jgi:heme oxygenase (mycobilin-producing)
MRLPCILLLSENDHTPRERVRTGLKMHNSYYNQLAESATILTEEPRRTGNRRKEGTMAVTAFITREFKPNSLPKAYELIVKLRSLATLEPGYITGQTMVSADNPNEITVMSTWESNQRWKDWQASDLRRQYTNKMDEISAGPEEVQVLMVLI